MSRILDLALLAVVAVWLCLVALAQVITTRRHRSPSTGHRSPSTAYRRPCPPWLLAR